MNNLEKSEGPGAQTADEPGYYRGRFMAGYIEEIKELKRAGEYGEAEAILIGLTASAQAWAREKDKAVPTWYADQLQLVRKRLARLRLFGLEG